MAEVDLNVVCKHCGSEVSPYITECPYCGERLRKRAPKIKAWGEPEPPPKERRRLRFPRRRPAEEERSLAWLSAQRPYATIALVLGMAVVYLADQASDLSIFDLGIFGGLDGEAWRLASAQVIHENVGYLLAAGLAVVVFGGSLERRYGFAVPLLVFALAGGAGMYLATVVESDPVAIGANGSALGLLGAWLVRDARDRRSGEDTESDLLGVAAIALVLALMPLLEDTANEWVGLGGAAVGALLGLALPRRR